MKPVSSGFNDAFNATTMYVDHKVIVEFGSNRFNDGQVVIATSTKVAHRGIDSILNDQAVFWKASDVFNNKNRNTMKWLVCDAGATINEREDGTGHRCMSLDEGEYERGWWSANKSNGSGVFAVSEGVQSSFFEHDGTTPYVRRCNKIVLYLTEGYPNMAEISVQYKNESNTWVDVELNRTLGDSEYSVTWNYNTDILISGLRVAVNKTKANNDYARLSELNAYWIKDISEHVINIGVSEIREEYEQTVPVGTTSANSVTVELDNTEGLFNANNQDSIYAPYIGPNNRVEVYYGIDKNQGVGAENYEYVQMGEFWTDEWENSDSDVATFNTRDFSRFLQDEKLQWGRVWTNSIDNGGTNMKNVLTDILAYFGMPLERIHIDETHLRGFQIVFLKDSAPWDLMGQLAFADQGMFGFDYKGDFYYHSYNTLNDAPYNSPVFTLDWDRNIIGGSTRTELYVNKVTVHVAPYNLKSTGVRKIWGPESPSILSWSKLAADIGPTDTSITVAQAVRQDSSSLTDNGWFDKNGLLFFPEFALDGGGKPTATVIGGELIKYKTRTDSVFQECERGYLDTVATTHIANDYIGEARFYKIEFDNAPALTVKYPFVTEIDSLRTIAGEENPQAYIIKFENDAFTAQFAIANIVNYYTWLEGTGQTLKDFDDKKADAEISFATSIAGEVAVDKAGRSTVNTELKDPSAENKDLQRRYGKNEIEVSNDWIQTVAHAQDIADILIDEYRHPRALVELSVVPNPALQLGDRVAITNFPQLDIDTIEYHVIKMDYSYDGGISCQMTLRRVKY